MWVYGVDRAGQTLVCPSFYTLPMLCLISNGTKNTPTTQLVIGVLKISYSMISWDNPDFEA